MKRILSASRPRIIRLLPILVLPLVVAACGTFQLASNTFAPAGKTPDQHQMDQLTCKDQASLAVNTAARQAGNFLLGMTIVGLPAAYELDKAKQREVFAQCMTARGYTVVPPDGARKQAALSQPPIAQAPVVTKKDIEHSEPKPTAPVGAGLSEKDDVAQLEKLKSLQNRSLITEEEYNRKKNEILDRM